jgi:hypothetical protein
MTFGDCIYILRGTINNNGYHFHIQSSAILCNDQGSIVRGVVHHDDLSQSGQVQYVGDNLSCLLSSEGSIVMAFYQRASS